MKKNLLLSVSAAAALFISANASAQMIPNNGFENWTTMGTYDEPDGWGTINSLSAFGYPVTVNKTTDMNSGSFAISLETMSYTDIFSGMLDTLPGIAWTGDFDSNFNALEGFAYTQTPTDLTGSFKYAPSGIDTGIIFTYLTKWNTMTNMRDTIAGGVMMVDGTTSTWTQFTIPLTYQSAVAPDTAVVWMVSSSGMLPMPGSELKVDDLAFVLPTGIAEPLTGTSKVFPNPASSNVSFSVANPEAATIELYDLEGRRIDMVQVTSNVINVSLEKYNAGLYMYALKAATGAVLERGKLTVTK